MKIRTRVFIAALFAMSVLTGGCAGTSKHAGEDAAEVRAGDRDPFERANRATLNFNLKIDRFALKPAAKAYDKLPQPVRNGVGNFFSNLWLPNTILNDLLQGKIAHAGRDTGRFAINTILGLFGLMDVATPLGLPRRSEDFGQTLAVWGAPAGPYLVLPLFGPSNLRDFAGLVPQMRYTDALSALDSPEYWYAGTVRLVNTRAGLLGLDEALDLQPDKYLFLREGYRQQRKLLIYDGNPPDAAGGVSEAQLIDELLEQEDAN